MVFLEEKELAKANAAAAGAAAGDPQVAEEAALLEIVGVGNSNLNANGGRAYSAEGGPGGERSKAGRVLGGPS